MTNPSGIIPINRTLVIEPMGGETKTAGGIFIPESEAERQKYGTMSGKVLALAPDAFTYQDGKPLPERPDIGSTVLFARYAGGMFKGADGEDYKIVEDEDIKGVMG